MPKDLVTFKREDGIKDEQVLIFWEFTEKSDFKGGGSHKTNMEGVCLKRGGLGPSADLQGGKKEGGWCF